MTESLTRAEILARLSAARDPVILIHVKPDGDAIGSAAALARYYIARGQAVTVLSADPIPERLAFLMEGIPTVPYTGRAGRTVLSLDVAAEGQLGSLAREFGVGAPPDFMIDHHETGAPFAPVYLLPHASATGEILADLLIALSGDAPLPRETATCLFAAITSDTGCFRFSNATGDTFRRAAELLDLGADGARVNHLLFESKSPRQLKAEAATAERMALAENGRISYAVLPRSVLSDIGDEYFETAIDVVREVQNVTVSFTMKEQPDGAFRVSLRSLSADVASVAAVHGGGGHRKAAGCTLRGMTAEDALALLLRELAPLA